MTPPAPTPPPPEADEIRLGRLLAREGLATEMQVATALRAQRGRSDSVPLGQLLVEGKILTQDQLDHVLDTFNKGSKLGSLLVQSGVITAAQLDHALALRETTDERLGRILVKLMFATDEQVRQAIAKQTSVAFVDLDQLPINRALSRLINQPYATRHGVVAVSSNREALTVCFDDPTDQKVIEELSRSTGRRIEVVTASGESIVRALARLYGDVVETPTATETLELVVEDSGDRRKTKYTDDPRREKTADAIVRRLLTAALDSRATDIHLETLSNRLQVRFRIDGMLEAFDLGDLQDASNQISREIVSKLKILSRLDIAERRRPQDGSFRVKVSRESGYADVDLRLSIVPTHYGESVVVRLLDRRNAPASLAQLQLPEPITAKLRTLLARPSGVFLVTGPTGSGKSTTLYAALMSVFSPKIRVLTAEDPIEYLYDEFSQSEVNEQVGNTFSSYLRAFLRHDPEVIMVGEVRDEETAQMVFRAAQTGHLLLSTLHTNSAIGCIPRLLDLKIDADSLASTIIGAMSQRLVRQVCHECRAEYTPPPEVLQALFPSRPDMTFVKGKGCHHCGLTGYRGRIAVAELWVPSNEDILLINKRAPLEDLFACAKASTLSMADFAWDNIVQHRTTVEELIRVLPYKAIEELRQKLATARPSFPMAVG